MALRAAIIVVSGFAVTPAVAGLLWLSSIDVPAVNRSVALSGPIAGFNQSQERIQVRLVPALDNEQRKEVLVRSVSGDASQLIPLKRGQTWASAKLDADLAHSPALEIVVQ